MTRIIFHGSDHIIEHPTFGAGKSYNDYGLGFYCTENPDMAKEWAVSQKTNGYANRYSIDCSNLDILNLNDAEYITLHWLAILLENRQFAINAPLAMQAKEYILSVFHVDYKNADCIIGYRADDSYFSFAQDFISGTISYRQLCYAMRLGKLGEQFVLKSKKAFDTIHFEGYEIADTTEWYPKRSSRDLLARKQYLDKERYHILPDDIFITEIIRKEMKANDPRLQ